MKPFHLSSDGTRRARAARATSAHQREDVVKQYHEILDARFVSPTGSYGDESWPLYAHKDDDADVHGNTASNGAYVRAICSQYGTCARNGGTGECYPSTSETCAEFSA